MLAPNPEKSLHIKGKRGPKTAEGRARALANLIPVKPGEVRNPDGRPNSGAAVKEWWNVMQGWPRTELEKVMADMAAPVNKVAAARAWLGACAAGGDLDRIMDRTDGKPQGSLDVTSNGETILLPIRLDGDREL